MPRVIVTAETGGGLREAIVYDERVLPSNLDNDHSSAQLIERVGWALIDAQEAEQGREPAEPAEP
jgi:hypothetical protein